MPPRKAEALAQAIAETIERPDHSRRMVAKAYDTLLQKFEFKKRMRRVEAFYDVVLNSSRHNYGANPTGKGE